jgi:polyketide synthase PksJ
MERLNKENIEDILALTPMQEGMLFHYLNDPESDYYFEQLSLEISGNIDKEIFEKSWNFVIKTNEMLRVVFRWEKVDNPVQIILKEHQLHPRYHDFSEKAANDGQNQLEETKVKDRKEKFDLQNVPFRVTLCKFEKGKYVMIISNHHILYDGWSNAIILKEFFQYYDDFVRKKPSIIPVKTKFKEFVKWLKNQDRQGQEKFWQFNLAGFSSPGERSIKKSEVRESKNTNTYDTGLEAAEKTKLEFFINNQKITLASFFYCAWGLLLQRYHNCDDVIFGTTVSGRSAPLTGIEDMVGLFINTIPFRVQTFPHETVKDLLHRSIQVLQNREPYEHTPLVNIKAYCDVNPQDEFFDSIVIIENYPLDRPIMQQNSNLSVVSFSMNEMTNYDLSLEIRVGDELKCSVTYNKDVFTDESIIRLMGHFEHIATDIAENPGKIIAGIEILPGDEKNQLLYEFNNTANDDYPKDKRIDQLLEEQVKRTPHNVAMLGPTLKILNCRSRVTNLTEKIFITYKELNKISTQLATLLQEKGIRVDHIVGIMVKRSIEMIIGIIGILKAGGTYLPLDRDYPLERIDYMLKDSFAKFVLGQQPFYAELENKYEVINLEEFQSYTKNERNSHYPINYPTDLVYVIYTSGSTGKPKGVMIEHHSVVNFIEEMTDIMDFSQRDTLLSLTTISFDIFGLEIYLPFKCGSRVVVGSDIEQFDPVTAAQVVTLEDVTMLQLTPSRLSVLLLTNEFAGCLKNLKRLIVGGEIFPAPLLEKTRGVIGGGCKIYNMYGPTETTIWSTAKDITTGEINIGKPILNTQVYILGKYGALQPINIVGELCIAGEGLARGYLNRQELTEERFKRAFNCHSFLVISSTKKLSKDTNNQYPMTNERLYRTGDLARWLPNGSIELLGRMDTQLKIRGFRVELGEIENHLLKYKDIKEAVVIVKEDVQNGNHLYAFIVSEKEPVLSELRAYLSKELPAYMIPSYFARIEKIPLTSSGKADRKALVFMASAEESRMRTGMEYVSPKTNMEKTIADIWKELLGIDKISVHDNFFDIGGNSILLIRLRSRLKKAFKKEIPMVTLFNYHTVSMLARYLKEGEKKNDDIPKRQANGGKEADKRAAEIAVIGMSGQFPGAINIDEFWENLKHGIESITFFSDEELDALRVEVELYNHPHFVRAKGILENMEYFDTFFFEYSPGEARLMDPQLRILHECVWEALENAGYDPGSYRGGIGLYVGSQSNSWWIQRLYQRMTTHSDLLAVGTLNDRDYLATRISYKLNLKGPAVTVQTACSTSLVAVDMACQELINGKCAMAVAGGISLTFEDQGGFLYEEGMVRSPDGHCRPFDVRARGTVGGNGVGIVVLKPLKKAVNDDDKIHAVIKGSATNNDGARKVGYTAPSVEGQAEVIQAALGMARVDAESIIYLETHGTGTFLGDSVEIEALKQVFNKVKKKSCCLGAVKANIGHLDAAAGIAGLIKTVLVLEHRLIPPSVNFEIPNSQIDLDNSPFYLNTQLKECKNGKYPLRAGVSSFGIGGTNAHVVLEEWPQPVIGHSLLGSGENKKELEYHLLLLSAKTQTALDRMTQNLADHFKKKTNLNLNDAAYTLQVGRKTFQYRRIAVCSTMKEAIRNLFKYGSARVGTFLAEEIQQIIFMFPGLGSQYVEMGRGLYENEPIFSGEMDRCFEILNGLIDDDIKEILYPSASNSPTAKSSKKINQIEITQPLIFIFEYSLAQLLMHWGIIPHAMIGYSFGEYVAACVSQVFSLEDALKLIVSRGHLMQKIPPGAMSSVPLSRHQVIPFLNDELSLAIDNGSSCIVAGTHKAVGAFEKRLKGKKIICMRLPVSHAVHSKMMQPVLEELKNEVSRVCLNKPQIPFISNVTGKWIKDRQAMDPGYWALHLQETVRFAEGLRELMKEPQAFFIEVGPGHELSSLLTRHLIKDNDSQQSYPVINLVRHTGREVPDVYFLLNKIGLLWMKGIAIDWERFHVGEKRNRIPLPSYPFESKRFWPSEHRDSLGFAWAPRGLGRSKKPDIADWFYLPQWERTQLLELPGRRLEELEHACWLIFIEGTGFSFQLSKQLKQEGNHLVTVGKGSAFRKLGEQRYEINPQQSSDYRILLEELQKINGIPFVILYLWGISRIKALVFGEEMMANGPDPDLGSLLYLVQAIVREEFIGEIRMYIVTSTIHEVTGEEQLTPQKAPVLGLAKVIPQEYTNIICRCIDIQLPEPGSTKEKVLIKQLLEEFRFKSADTIVAYRANYRWVQIFKPLRLENYDQPVSRLRKQGVYLITGGLGKIGFTLAGYLAETQKATLILIGRTKLPPANEWKNYLAASNETNSSAIKLKIRKILKLQDRGARVIYFNCDVKEYRQMQKIITLAEQQLGQINGVIHAAVLPQRELFKSIDEIDKNEFIKQFQPKVYGLLNLGKIFRGRPLDFCILISSPASILGGLGHAVYAAANQFLDVFIHWFNRVNDVPWITVNWGDWLFEGEENKQMPLHDALGYLLMTPEEGIKTFERILSFYPINQVVVSAVDFQERINLWVRGEFKQKTAKESSDSRGNELILTPHARPDLLTPYVAPHTHMEKIISHIWQSYFGLEQVGVEDNFFELGATSLDIIQLNKRVKESIGRDIPVNVFFRYPTISSLALHLSQVKGEDHVPSLETEEKHRAAKIQNARKNLKKRARILK